MKRRDRSPLEGLRRWKGAGHAKEHGQSTDGIARFVLAIVDLLMWLMQLVTGAPATIVGALALILLATSLAGFCPRYALPGIATRKGPPGAAAL